MVSYFCSTFAAAQCDVAWGFICMARLNTSYTYGQVQWGPGGLHILISVFLLTSPWGDFWVPENIFLHLPHGYTPPFYFILPTLTADFWGVSSSEVHPCSKTFVLHSFISRTHFVSRYWIIKCIVMLLSFLLEWVEENSFLWSALCWLSGFGDIHA